MGSEDNPRDDNRIKAVATDLSAAYAAAVIKHLPASLLVADRFYISSSS